MVGVDKKGKGAIPERLFKILRSDEYEKGAWHFPPTEIFNEGWMLRLVLDALKANPVPGHPLNFLDDDASWFSEARLISPFLRRAKRDLPDNVKDVLGEGYTNADGVIGHFAFREGAKARLVLAKEARQFLVVEAKLLSHLSSGTSNAITYNQAARNIACMVAVIQESIDRHDLESVSALKSVGFFVVAPKAQIEKQGKRNIRTYLDRKAITQAIEDRIRPYEQAFRNDVQLRKWKELFDSLLGHLTIEALSWEDVIAPISDTALKDFYKECLRLV